MIAELLNVYRSAFRTSQNSFEFQITLKIKYSHLRSQSSLHVERAYKTTGNFSVFSATYGTQKYTFLTLVSITSDIACSWKLKVSLFSDSSRLLCDRSGPNSEDWCMHRSFTFSQGNELNFDWILTETQGLSQILVVGFEIKSQS